MRKFSDYTYRNSDDSIRVRIYKRQGMGWDYDYFTKSGISEFGVLGSVGELFFIKKKVREEAEYTLTGELFSIQVENITEGWR